MIFVDSVVVSPGNITLKKGSWYYGVSATVCPANADCTDVTWYSSNSSVASVNASSGYICANAVGTTTIYATATDGSGCSDYITVTVTNTVSVTSVTLDRSTASIEVGSSITLGATVCPENAGNRTVNWSSSNTNVATVNGGVVCALAQGSARITATAADGSGKSASCTITVTGATLVNSICISPDTRTMITGKSAYFYATVCPENADNRCVTWSSSNTSVASVNSVSGLVYAHSAGNAIIYATAQDGSDVVGTCALTVINPICVECITLSRTYLTLYKGNAHKITATVCPENATTKAIRWRSSKTSVATVNAYTGTVTAKAAGTAYIYAEAQDGSGVSERCTVVVKQTVVCCAEETPVNKVPGSTFADPVDVYTGAHLLNNTLISLFGGQGIKFTAHYNSTQLACGMLGTGWSHNYEKHIDINGSEAYVYNNPAIFSKYTAESECCSTFNCVSANKNGYVLTVDNSRTYPYIIDCNSARTEYYNAAGDLAKIVDHQGFETTISYSDTLITITDGVSGKKIYLEKDSSCKIVRVYDDAARAAVLTYTGNLLTSICDVNGNTLTYAYDEDNRVKSGTDSKGICYFENTYDDYGRVLTQKDALNHISYFDYSDDDCECCDGDTRITTSRNGKTSRRVYDCNGLMIHHTDENGNTKHFEYDSRYNVIKETDAKGNSVVKTYNSFNKPVTITDKKGNTTTMTYDARGNVVKITYPAVGGIIPVETFVYNSCNQMTQHTDLNGTVTVYTYDSNGMPATKKVGSKNAIVYSYQGGLLKSQTDACGNTTQYAHNAIGQITSKTDADNKVTTYTYDASGNLLSSTDANGKTITNTYDGNYQRTSVTDANGNVTSYSYNGNMKNDCVTFPDGHTIRYEFDVEDRVVRTIDQQNNATVVAYDDGGRIVSKRMADGAYIQYEYDAVGSVVKETNAKGAVTTKTYDANGNVLTVTDDDGNVTTYEYNALNKPTKVTNAVAGATVYEYSQSGQLLKETDALGNVKTYTYDAFGNLLTATDAKGNVTTYTYDANNNMLTVKDALNHVTTYTYNCLNQCVSVKDALNNTIYYGYDALGRRTTVTDARGNTFTTQYDGNGNVIKTMDAKGNTISETTYNALNLPLTVSDAMGKVTTYTYNALGKVASITDSMSHCSEYGYDAIGRNTSVRDAANNISTATFDLLGNITRLAGPLGGATTYTYDDMGKLVSESTVSGGTKTYTYNELNLRKKFTNARGQVRQFFYDAKGRITGFTSPEGTASYTYDANDNILTVTDSTGTTTRTYDALNRVTSCTDTYGKVSRYEYDAVGNLTKLIYPDNTAVTYAYDANHNLIRVTDWASRVTTYTYDVNNRVIGVTKPDGSVTTTVYDNKQRVTSTVERTAGGAVISGFEYTYDDLSRTIEEKVLANSTKMCYAYDSLSRVTSRTVKSITDNSVISTENYTYDAAGNMTDAPDSCLQYDTNNRLVVFNGSSVSYDLDGNVTNDGVCSYTYDSASRLTSFGGHTYTYTSADIRIRNLCFDEDTTYTYDTNCKLSKLLTKTTNGTVTKYVYGRGLIGEEVNNTFKTYHFDCRGSTVSITDASGNITDTFAYDTYGNLVSRTGTSKVIFLYNGRDGVITDDNGLYYMRARYYSPDMRRFVNADIVAGQISNAVTLNRFAYANGNPVSFVDPFGLSAERGVSTAKNIFKWFGDLHEQIDLVLKSKSLCNDIMDYLSDGFHIVPKGAYAIIKGARSNAALRRGIAGTRYAVANADNYIDIFKNIHVPSGLKSEFFPRINGKWNGGAIFNYVGIAINTTAGVLENIENGTRTQKIVSDAIVDIGVDVGIIAASTSIGAAVGSVVPGLGNIVGAGVGMAAGWLIDGAVNAKVFGGESAVYWAKEGAGWVADRVVDAGEWIADTAVEAWDATTDFVEDAGEWIADTASNAWNATTNFVEDAGEAVGGFFEDAGNAIGGFFSGLFA